MATEKSELVKDLQWVASGLGRISIDIITKATDRLAELEADNKRLQSIVSAQDEEIHGLMMQAGNTGSVT